MRESAVYTTSGRLALGFFLVCSASQALAVTGRTPGTADVSQNGEASYSIPIFAPPGTHGMTPQLALTYGHRSGSAQLGAGWSIAGLSAITRYQSSWAADGTPRDVRNDYSDRFCLNGNKPRLTSAPGTYGQAGATYRTELETSRESPPIYGATGNGPTHFIVEAKDGLIYEYGMTNDSRIESVAPVDCPGLGAQPHSRSLRQCDRLRLRGRHDERRVPHPANRVHEYRTTEPRCSLSHRVHLGRQAFGRDRQRLLRRQPHQRDQAARQARGEVQRCAGAPVRLDL